MLEKSAANRPTASPSSRPWPGFASVRAARGEGPRDLAAQIHALRKANALELAKVGELAMAAEDTPAALRAFEAAREVEGPAFRHNLELGVLYLACQHSKRPATPWTGCRRKPAYPMALFKRAQVSVLLREPDRASRIEAARRGAGCDHPGTDQRGNGSPGRSR